MEGQGVGGRGVCPGSAPSVAVSFRATSFPLCEKDPSLLCSYFSPSSWAVRTHKVLSKASLKASRNQGTLRLLWERVWREDTTGHREACEKFILWNTSHRLPSCLGRNHLEQGSSGTKPSSKIRVRRGSSGHENGLLQWASLPYC